MPVISSTVCTQSAVQLSPLNGCHHTNSPNEFTSTSHSIRLANHLTVANGASSIIQPASSVRLDERKSKLHSKNSIRLINGSMGTLRRSPNASDPLPSAQRADYTTDDNQDTNSLLYRRMLSYSTHSLEPNKSVGAPQENSGFSQPAVNSQRFGSDKPTESPMNSKTTNKMKSAVSRTLTSGMINAMSRTLTNGGTNGLTAGWSGGVTNGTAKGRSAVLGERRTIKNSLRIKSEDKENEMMRLLGQAKHSAGDTCSESCCEVRPANGHMFRLPKIRLNRELIQASLNNQTGASLLRGRSMFSKSLDSLANLHLYESLDPIAGNALQHRISRKRTLNVIFPQISLKSKNSSEDGLKESNEDLLNNDLLDDDLIDDLNEDVDLNDFGFDSNDECLNDDLLNGNFNEDEIEFSINAGNTFCMAENGKTLLGNLDRQQTTKIVLKKQPKVRQLRPAKLMKDSIVQSGSRFGGDAFLAKKNSFLSNYYGSESSDESPNFVEDLIPKQT